MARAPIAAFLLVVPLIAHAADQTVLGTQLLVRDPATPEHRKIVVKAREVASDDSIVGDPVASGAMLTVTAEGATSTSETWDLPPGPDPTTGVPYWSGDATRGFTYRDSRSVNGPVRFARIRKTAAGVFRLRAVILAKVSPVAVVPPDDGTAGCALLAINGGDSYSVRFAGGDVTNDGSAKFEMRWPTSEGSCVTLNGCAPGNLAACEYQPATTYTLDPPNLQQTIPYTDVTGATRSLNIEIRRPQGAPMPMPIVIWSHGGASGKVDPSGVGDEIAVPFVEAGYVGVFIAHPPRTGAEVDALCSQIGVTDCRAGVCAVDGDCAAVDDDGGRCVDGLCLHFKHLNWDRPYDVAAVIDWLEAQAAGPWAGLIDTSKIVYAGHSAGAGATMMVAGATRQFGGVDTLLLDSRPIAFISESPQGPGDEDFTESSFTGDGCFTLGGDPSLCLARPHLVLTGVGDDTGDSVGENRRRTFDLMPTGEKTLVFVLEEPARHTTFEYKTDACERYAVDEGLDPAVYPARCATYLTWLRSAMLAFLDAHVRGSATAEGYLASNNLTLLTEAASSWERR